VCVRLIAYVNYHTPYSFEVTGPQKPHDAHNKWTGPKGWSTERLLVFQKA